MRPCLKSHPSTPTGVEQSPHPARKCVAFLSDACLETIFMADEWDRTPTEPSRKLSYQELLELKEIQRSLPRANQPPDLLTGRAGRHFLSGVPIGLLPLLPESDSSSAKPPPAPSYPTSTSTSSSWTPFNPKPTPPAALHPPQFSHNAPGRQPPPRQKPKFSFIPLLDTPASASTPPSTHSFRSRSPSPARSDPPTPSLTNASLESSPASVASSCSIEPPMFRLPPGRGAGSYFPTYKPDADPFPRSLTSAMESMKVQPPAKTPQPTVFGRSNAAFKPAYTVAPPPPPPSKPERKRNVILINGIEIDLDDDEEDDKPPSPSPPPPIAQPRPLSQPICPSPSSITSNGLPTPPPSTSPSPTSQNVPLPPVDSDPQFTGLHAPIRFKRAVPPPNARPSSPVPSSPPAYPSSPVRRGSICGSQSIKQRQQQNRPGPILLPRA